MLGINAITITPQALLQISDIDEFKGLWTGLERHTTGLNLLGDVADYGADFQKTLTPLREQTLTPEIIRAIHMSQTGGKTLSNFKSEPSTLSISQKDRLVGMLETAPPEQVEPLLKKLCEWTDACIKERTLHPLLVAAVFTSVFLQISPFESGNLQTVRFLAMLLLMKAGYTYAPYASLTPIIETNADEFYKALKHNQDSLEAGRPDWSQWLSFFLSILQTQKQTLHGRLYAKETDLRNLPTLSLKIMEQFKSHERLQMKDIIKLTKGRRATIKLRIGELVDAGYLRRHGQARATWYSLI